MNRTASIFGQIQCGQPKNTSNFMVSDLKYAVHRPILLLSYGFYSAIVAYQIVSSKFKRAS